jgi:hypothetical protein
VLSKLESNRQLAMVSEKARSSAVMVFVAHLRSVSIQTQQVMGAVVTLVPLVIAAERLAAIGLVSNH